MRKKLLAITIACCIGIALMLGNIQAGKKKQKENKNIEAVAQANNQFAFELYSKLKARKGNLFISPVSIHTALSMTLGGARNNTAKEMKGALHLTLADKDLHAATGGFLNGFSSGKQGLELSIANALWGQTEYPFRDEFLEESKKHYNAGFNLLDFKNDTEAARQAINKWVEKKTNGKIKNLMPESSLSKETRMVLTNAIYFNGEWQLKFEARDTLKRKFNITEDKSIDVYMMHLWGERFNYMKGDGFAALEMPYKGNEYSMVILLPDKIDGLESFEANLSTAKLEEWLGKLEMVGIKELSLPKFRVTGEFMLAKLLQELGIKDAFESTKADFSGISGTKGLFITEVVHKTFVEANEEGTKAAAATGVAAPEEKLGKRKKPIYFNVDRPFFFLIRQKSTGAVLFMGRVCENPQKEGLQKLTKTQIKASAESELEYYDKYTIDSLVLESEYGKHKDVWIAKATVKQNNGEEKTVVLVLDQYTGKLLEEK